MMRADRVMNKAGAPCMDCKRLTFEMRRVCPWCAKARQAKIDAEAALIEDQRLKLMPDYHHKAADCWDDGTKRNDVRRKQLQIEAEGMSNRVIDG